MTARECYEKLDKNSKLSEHWAISIYDTTGNIRYGYINACNSINTVHDAVLDHEVSRYNLGYNSLSLHIDIFFVAKYASEERCLMDGYEKIEVNGPYNIKTLYVKKTSNDWSFAEVTGY